jgi:hypothetical protein
MKELKTKLNIMIKSKIYLMSHMGLIDGSAEFLNSENTESVSGSSQESSVSHAVRDRNANEQDSPKELEPVAEALEIRTEDVKFCQCPKFMGSINNSKGDSVCLRCNGIRWQK